MINETLLAQNTRLRKMLAEAGLEAQTRELAAELQHTLTGELHHRMKNLLTMVTAIIRQTMRTASSLAEAEEAIGARLVALGKAHDLLLQADWSPTQLRDVAVAAIEPCNPPTARINIAGDDIEITSAAILPLTLIINELCTNATKYGALSTEHGKVDIAWKADTARDVLVITWTESGGPPPGKRGARNFGTRLIEEAIPRQLSGTGQLSFPSSGAQFELSVPLRTLRPQ